MKRTTEIDSVTINAEVRCLRLRQPYPERMRQLLDDLTTAFAQMPCPPPEQFRYHGQILKDNGSAIIKQINDERDKAFEILGDSKGDGINASNLRYAGWLLSYCEVDAILWLIPQVLRIVQDNWNVVVGRVSAEFEPHEPKQMGNEKTFEIALLKFWSNWASESGVIAFSGSVNRISRHFCDIYYGEGYDRESISDPFYPRKYKENKIKEFNQYMTPDMRRTLKAYIVAWYEVFGRKKTVNINGYRFLRTWAHNFLI